MALATGPNVSWLCMVSCDRMPASSDCRHDTAAASRITAASGDCCDQTGPSVRALLPQDVRHTVAFPVSGGPHPVLRSQFSQSLLNGSLSGTSPLPSCSPDKHSLYAALRL